MINSRLFEKRALFLMNSLYEENDEGCMSLMNTENKVWGIRVAPVECAFDNGMIDVVGHPCVQRLLNRVWYNDTASMWRDWIKVVLNDFFLIRLSSIYILTFNTQLTFQTSDCFIHYVPCQKRGIHTSMPVHTIIFQFFFYSCGFEIYSYIVI